MNNFVTLYLYEYKKLLKKKLIWITFLLFLVAIIVSFCVEFIGNYYVDGVVVDTNINMHKKDKAYAAALSGRAIDQTLLEETIAAYRKIPPNTESHYNLTEEYQQYAHPYNAIFNFIHGTTKMLSSEVRLTWQPDEKEFYSKRQSFLMNLMDEKALSDGEKQFWKNREMQIPKPLVYEEHGGYDKLLSTFQTIGLLELFLVSIALSGIFHDEHIGKVDQIILACPMGKTKLYWAKIVAGISFSVISTMIMFTVAFLATFCLNGLDGFHAAFQLMYTRNSDPITCGQAILIAYGCMVFTAIVVSTFVMVLSELLHSNIATLAISMGLFIIPMVISIPEQYRTVAQMYNWLPWSFLAPWNVFDQYTFSVFGHYFTPWQAVPTIYIVANIVIAFAGKPLYKRYQISGR